MRTLAVILFSLAMTKTFAQYSQPLRGTVSDQLLQQPLEGATVTLAPLGKTTVTDREGVFRFTGIPVGTYHITVTFMGYRDAAAENITVNSGKETVLNIRMETLVKTGAEVRVKVSSKKNKPINDMSLVSARAFTVEETQKYAAAVNDPLRMATGFAGVMAVDDGNNSIVIRGNSPTGLLWRMEGMDIPNPNHFGSPGNSGGGISILSAQLLANSDFITGAFAAEYGNALSGVFDLRLRKGNNEKNEFSLQAGVLGLNAAAEGPFSKGYKGSYLVNYRYSTLTLLNKLGVLPDESATDFQDLSFHLVFPTQKLGQFTVFGFGGLSDDETAAKEAGEWQEKNDRYASRFISNTGMTGVTHSILLGNRLNIRTGFGFSRNDIGYDETYTEDDLSLSKTYEDRYKTQKWSFNSTAHYRISRKLHLRAGLNTHRIGYSFYQLSPRHEGEPLREMLNAGGHTFTHQLFVQGQYRPTDEITVQAGLHYFRLALNKSHSIEPRLSLKWQVSPAASLALAYGSHSQMQTLSVYFTRQPEPGGTGMYPNRNLDLTRSSHYVFSYSQKIGRSLVAKTEIYYQRLFRVPVSIYDSSSLSALNNQGEYVIEPMENSGTGRNYGVEFSLERHLKNHFYLNLNQSLYQSKYRARDGVERNTRFNGNYITALTAGKDFLHEWKPRRIGLNLKTIWAGGYRNTPIDLEASARNGYTVFDEKQAFSLQNKAYFRTDIRMSITWNRKKLTSTLSLDIQNVTNRLNLFNQWYDDEKNEIVTNYQTGLIPVLNYKIEF